MKLRALLLLSAFLSVAGFESRAAEPVTSFTVLSPSDVKIYGDILAAQKSGQNGRADRLASQLSDKSLMGYVLEERYLGPHYHSSFSELKAWLENYGDLASADRIYKLAVKRAPKKTSVPAPIRAHWRGVSNDPAAFENASIEHRAAERIAAQLRMLEREERPEAAEALWKRVSAQSQLATCRTRPTRRFCGHRLHRRNQISWQGSRRIQASCSRSA